MQDTAARRLREDDHSESRRQSRLRADDVGAPLVADGYAPVYAENGRRTVRITGHPVPPRRRPGPAQSQIQARPDRIALWAFLLGLFLVFMAVATANAAPL